MKTLNRHSKTWNFESKTPLKIYLIFILSVIAISFLLIGCSQLPNKQVSFKCKDGAVYSAFGEVIGNCNNNKLVLN